MFNGSDLGKSYAASGLLERLLPEIADAQKQHLLLQQKENIAGQKRNMIAKQNDPHHSTMVATAKESAQNVIDILTKEEYNGTLAAELQNELKKRKRKKLRPE